MATVRTIKCDIPGCEAQHTEKTHGDGFPGWGELKGIALNGVANPSLCPKHLAMVAEYIDRGLSEDDLD